jgi:hypothetical protein
MGVKFMIVEKRNLMDPEADATRYENVKCTGGCI